MRHLLDVAVAGNAIQGGVGGRFQGGRVDSPEALRPGACQYAGRDRGSRTVLGMQLRCLLAAEAGGQEGSRNGSEPE